MKRLFLLLMIVLGAGGAATGQSRQKLYYFTDKDNHTGIKNAGGKVIIQATFNDYFSKPGDSVSGEIIFLAKRSLEPMAAGYGSPLVAYSRDGEFLFAPFWYDNGPDYISEGLFRIVLDNKIGFADREGKTVIPPQFGFATPFLHGLSFYCTGCIFYRDTLSGDAEHNLTLTAGKWGIVGKDGTILNPAATPVKEKIDDGELADFVEPGITDERLDITDSLIARLPPQFIYTQEEEKLLQKVKSSAYLGSMVSANVLTDSAIRVSYEIVERPKPTFPFYWIKGFHRINGVYTDAEENFLISSNGADIYKYQPGLNDQQLLVPWKAKLRRR